MVTQTQHGFSDPPHGKTHYILNPKEYLKKVSDNKAQQRKIEKEEDEDGRKRQSKFLVCIIMFHWYGDHKIVPIYKQGNYSDPTLGKTNYTLRDGCQIIIN